MSSADSLFDQHAADYDSKFSHSWLGNYYRKRTHKVFDQYITQPERILELNAGTGEDAIYLAKKGHKVVATDLSESMLKVINGKVTQQKLQEYINVKRLDIKRLNDMGDIEFDAIVSNFGGLNCIDNWKEFARNSHSILTKQGVVIACVMGPMVPWEWIWFTLKGDFSQAFRRVKGKCEWNGSTIYYPRVNQFESAMKAESFNLIYQEGLGVIMPPPYTNHHVEKWKKSYTFLEKMEDKICRSKWACNLADHYILVFQKN